MNAYLNTEAELWALLLPTMAAAGHVPSTALIPKGYKEEQQR